MQHISIHAPARGASIDKKSFTFHHKISIHAPARGASRIHQERRSVWSISIHAPARGASRSDSLLFTITYFNSRPCERGFFRQHLRHGRLLFQFTPLREGLLPSTPSTRPCAISIHAPARGASRRITSKRCNQRFQFTPLREGLQLQEEIEKQKGTISIHAPARGASPESGSQ